MAFEAVGDQVGVFPESMGMPFAWCSIRSSRAAATTLSRKIAPQSLLCYVELQRLLRKSKDARAKDYLLDNARFTDKLVACSRDYMVSFRRGRMPEWIRAYRSQAPEDEVELSR